MTSNYICTACGYGSQSWFGKCPSCAKWGTLKQSPFFQDKKSQKSDLKVDKALIYRLSKAKKADVKRIATNIYEFDRVLGGGFVKGEVVLISGEPGIGKSTLLLKSISQLNGLYVSGEESLSQIRHHYQRLGIKNPAMLFSDTAQIEAIFKAITQDKLKLDLCVIDSLQTIYSAETGSLNSGITKIKTVIYKIIEFAKKTILFF